MSKRIRYILIAFKVTFLIASVYSFFSAYSTLKEYVHQAPRIKVTDEDVFIRGVPMSSVFHSLTWGCLTTLLSWIVAVIEYVYLHATEFSKITS
jgi:hypothetical protein